MRTVDPALLQHFRENTTTLALCWLVEKRDGTMIRGTEHDQDVVVPAFSPDDDLSGTYLAGSNITGSDVKKASDMSVDNMEVEGGLVPIFTTTDLTVADIESGLLDRAPVTLFVINWRDPSMGVLVTSHGYLGEVPRDSDGRYKTEIRGLVQLLHQNQGRNFSERCDVKTFGDARCKLDVAALAQPATVTAVTNRRRFDLNLVPGGSPALVAGYFYSGALLFTGGANAGFTRQVKRDDASGSFGSIDLWEPAPFDISPGDTVLVKPGCDRTWEACVGFNNQINFRGHGRWIPGIPNIIRAPG